VGPLSDELGVPLTFASAHWLPVQKTQFPGVTDLISHYQARATAEGVDPLGYYMPPWAYAQLQVLQQAVEATKVAR
jgi:branched-chain amino acid transport system substrate-binding protein